MRISTKLFIAALVPAIMAIAMGFGLYTSSRTVEQWQPQQREAARISGDVSDLSELARSYALTHEDRPRRQFLARLDRARAGVAELRELSKSRHVAELEDLAYDLTLADSLFGRLVSNYELGGAESGDPLHAAAERRFSGQLFIRLQGANSSAVRISQLINEDIVASQQTFSVFATSLMALVALLLTAGLLGLLSSISRSLAVLTTGTERIGAGELDHRMGLHSQDELGELARSFDRMTTRLKTLIVTKTQLEQEVEARIVAQDRARLEARMSSALADASARLAASTDLDRALLATIATGSEILGSVGAVLADRVGTGWRTRQIHGVPIGEIGEFHTDEESPARAALLRTKEPQLISDAFDHPGANPAMAERCGYRSYVAYPLLYRDEVMGAISFFFAEHRESLAEHEKYFLGRLAYVIAVSIQNARLLEAERAARREADHELRTTSLLLQAASELAKWTEPRALLQRLAEVLHAATPHSRTAVMLWHEDTATLELAAVAGIRPFGATGTQFPHADLTSATKRLLAERGAGFVDFDGVSPEERDASPATGSRLMYLAPITLADRFFGLVAIDDPGERRPFAFRETEIIRAIAAQAAVALENARLYETERTIAERLQSAMLAMPDRIAGVDFGYEYRSASEWARVGGDFYDLFEIDDRLLGITIGDIAGKGLNAAVLTSLVKNAVRAHAMEKGSTPGRILSLTNEVVYRATGVESFATVFFGVLDRESGAFQYSNAGHTSSIVVREDGSSERLVPTGAILGAFPDVEYAQAEIEPLGRKDAMLLFTDGLIEGRSGTELYGDDRLERVFVAHAAEDPDEMIRAVIDDVIGFTGGTLSDDVALMALRLGSVETDRLR